MLIKNCITCIYYTSYYLFCAEYHATLHCSNNQSSNEKKRCDQSYPSIFKQDKIILPPPNFHKCQTTSQNFIPSTHGTNCRPILENCEEQDMKNVKKRKEQNERKRTERENSFMEPEYTDWVARGCGWLCRLPNFKAKLRKLVLRIFLPRTEFSTFLKHFHAYFTSLFLSLSFCEWVSRVFSITM